MNQDQFSAASTDASSWAALKKDFEGGNNDVACYQLGTSTYFASEPKGAPISPLWLLTMIRPSRAGLKGLALHTNFRNGIGSRSSSEIGIMALTLKGLPTISRTDKLQLQPVQGGAVHRVSITDRLADALAKQFPVLPGTTQIVSDIGAISASVKDKGGYKVAGTHTVHRLYLATAYILLRHKHAAKTKDGVVALVVDKTGNIVSWGMKNPEVSCWHGETSAIMRLRGQLPAGGCVFSTLKPCKMCGGLISDASGKKIGAYYGQDDAGGDAKNTALDQDRHNFALDTHKGDALPRGLVVQIGDEEKVPVGDRLQTEFKAQQKIGSPIDYVTSDAANDLMAATRALFQAKIQKYKGAEKTNIRNENTRRAVEYLAGFLEHQGVIIR